MIIDTARCLSFALPELLSKWLLIFLSSFWTSDEIPGCLFFRGGTCYNANCTQAGDLSSYNCTLGSHNIQARVAKTLFCLQHRQCTNELLSFPWPCFYPFSQRHPTSRTACKLPYMEKGFGVPFELRIISCALAPSSVFLFSITGLCSSRSPGFSLTLEPFSLAPWTQQRTRWKCVLLHLKGITRHHLANLYARPCVSDGFLICWLMFIFVPSRFCHHEDGAAAVQKGTSTRSYFLLRFSLLIFSPHPLIS